MRNKPPRIDVSSTDTTNNHQAMTTGAVTEHYDFFESSPTGQCLFSVNAGIPMKDAFDQLSALMSSSIASIDLIACETKDADGVTSALWQSVHLLNFSYALIQSMHAGHLAHEKRKS